MVRGSVIMNCPKCGKPVGDHDALCPNCGAELFIETALADKIFEKSKPFNEEPPQEKKPKKPRNKSGMKKALKLGAIVCAAVVVIIIVIVIVVSLTSGEGRKLAEKASDFIGADFDIAEKKLDAKFKKESAYKGLTNVIQYNRIAESDESVRVDGVTYPEWAVLITTDDEGRILTVKYADFASLKGDIMGTKKDRIVNLDRFKVGASRGDVEDELDMDFYSVTYTKDGVSYTYRYWYENDNGDEQPVVLSVNFDSDGDYVSYSSVLVYHQYM